MEAFRQIVKWTVIALTIFGIAAYFRFWWLIIRTPFDILYYIFTAAGNFAR